ncbi:MAG TPA: hypothetical protein VF518_16310, partial [Polyangia bacterium]
IADEILSCIDFVTVIQTLSLYTDLIAQHLGRRHRIIRWATSIVSAIARRLTRKLQPPPEASEIPKQNIRWLW